jgi:phage-related minor tail protein
LFHSPGGGGVGTSLINGLGSLVASLVGSPGRATGGPVSGGRAYVVGERGPELFVPSGTGRVEQLPGRTRDVRVAISLNSPAGVSEPQALRQSSRQVARAVRSALARDGR